MQLPDQVAYGIIGSNQQSTSEYIRELRSHMETAHLALREKHLLFKTGDQFWMINKRRRVGENPKLQSRFVGPYHGIEFSANHTY